MVLQVQPQPSGCIDFLPIVEIRLLVHDFVLFNASSWCLMQEHQTFESATGGPHRYKLPDLACGPQMNSRSKLHFQRKLNLPRPVDLSADHAEVSLPDVASGISESRSIEGIEELGPELNVESLVGAEAIVFEKTSVPVTDPVDTDVGRGSG